MPAVIKVLFPLLIKSVEQIADKLVEGEQLSDDSKRIVITAFVVLVLWGKKFALDTETDMDDTAVETAINFVTDTASEAGIVLPSIVV